MSHLVRHRRRGVFYYVNCIPGVEMSHLVRRLQWQYFSQHTPSQHMSLCDILLPLMSTDYCDSVFPLRLIPGALARIPTQEFGLWMVDGPCSAGAGISEYVCLQYSPPSSARRL